MRAIYGVHDVLKYFPVQTLRNDLLRWWCHEKRQFPWRETRDPYMVLVAEVLLHNAALMAYSLGLGSVCIGSLVQTCERNKSIQQLIKLPEKHKVHCALAIGYPRFEFKKWPERQTPKVTWL